MGCSSGACFPGAKPSGCPGGCGATCGCGPCRAAHGHDHEDDRARSLPPPPAIPNAGRPVLFVPPLRQTGGRAGLPPSGLSPVPGGPDFIAGMGAAPRVGGPPPVPPSLSGTPAVTFGQPGDGRGQALRVPPVRMTPPPKAAPDPARMMAPPMDSLGAPEAAMKGGAPALVDGPIGDQLVRASESSAGGAVDIATKSSGWLGPMAGRRVPVYYLPSAGLVPPSIASYGVQQAQWDRWSPQQQQLAVSAAAQGQNPTLAVSAMTVNAGWGADPNAFANALPSAVAARGITQEEYNGWSQLERQAATSAAVAGRDPRAVVAQMRGQVTAQQHGGGPSAAEVVTVVNAGAQVVQGIFGGVNTRITADQQAALAAQQQAEVVRAARAQEAIQLLEVQMRGRLQELALQQQQAVQAGNPGQADQIAQAMAQMQAQVQLQIAAIREQAPTTGPSATVMVLGGLGLLGVLGAALAIGTRRR